MKKYEKPAIEELNIGATMSLMAESMPVGDGTGSGEYAPGRKDKGEDLDFDDEGW